MRLGHPSLSSALLALCVAVAMVAVAMPARAAPPDQERPTDSPAAHVDALADAVRRIERTTHGQVLSAERMQFDGRDVNRIKVVDERGRVRVYMDDPQTRVFGPTPRQSRNAAVAIPTRDNDD